MQVRVTTDAEVADIRRKSTAKKSPRSSAVHPERSPFLSILEEVLPGDSANGPLQTLWENLPGLERDLLDHPSNENFRKYRETVTEIAKETLRINVQAKKLQFKRRSQEYEHTVIHVIDQRLQKMALVMLSRDNSAFALLKSVEEIRGLLLDMRE